MRWPHQLTEGHSRHQMNVTYPMTLGTKIQYPKKISFSMLKQTITKVSAHFVS